MLSGTHVCHVQAIEKEKVKSVVTVLRKSPWTERYPVTRDIWEEFAGGDQVAGGWEQPLDPEVDTLKWMKERQHSYMDAQLDFWLLVRPLTDGVRSQANTSGGDYCPCGIGHQPWTHLYAHQHPHRLT